MSSVLGIFGGTFDPIHCGHLELARELREALALSKVRLIPAGDPPHRSAPAVSAAHRLKMVELAVANHPALEVDAREIAREGRSYTVTTLEELREEDGGRTLALIVGGDAFLGLATWHRWREVFDLAHLVVVARPGVALSGRLPAELEREWRRRRCDDTSVIFSRTSGAIIEPRITAHPISASAIRKSLARGSDGIVAVRALLPPAVLAYIERNRLYLSPRMRLNKIQKTALSALDDIKARDITVLDVRKLTSLFDTMIIATGESPRQVKSLARHVRDKLTGIGAPIVGVEGEEGGEWVLVDAGDIVVHIMQPAMRAHYNLEELWAPPAAKRRTGRAAA